MSVREQGSASVPSTVWSMDRGAFRHALGEKPFRFRHALSGRPGFDVDAVVELVARVPPSWSRPHPGDRPLVFPEKVRMVDTSAAEVARNIAQRRNRLAIYYLERIQPYRTVIFETRDEIVEALGGAEGGISETSLSFFLASPGTVVQSHFDRHHNLLLQLEGTKEITVGSYADPVDDQRVIEGSRRHDHNNLAELPTRTHTFVLGPGDALYIPPYAFHWVHGGSDVSVALSYSFATAATQRAAHVYWCNANLRRLRLRPRPPGHSERRDRAKAFAIRKAGQLRDAVLSRK